MIPRKTGLGIGILLLIALCAVAIRYLPFFGHYDTVVIGWKHDGKVYVGQSVKDLETYNDTYAGFHTRSEFTTDREQEQEDRVELIASGHIFTVEAETQARLLETDGNYDRVLITEGEHAGQSAWLPKSSVHKPGDVPPTSPYPALG